MSIFLGVGTNFSPLESKLTWSLFKIILEKLKIFGIYVQFSNEKSIDWLCGAVEDESLLFELFSIACWESFESSFPKLKRKFATEDIVDVDELKLFSVGSSGLAGKGWAGVVFGLEEKNGTDWKSCRLQVLAVQVGYYLYELVWHLTVGWNYYKDTMVGVHVEEYLMSDVQCNDFLIAVGSVIGHGYIFV